MSTPFESTTASAWPRGIIFDLDGTLIDSVPDITAAVNRALAELEISIDAEQARRFLGAGARQLMQRALESHGIDADEDRLAHLAAAFTARYREYPCCESIFYPGVEQALERLHKAGVALAICTNKTQEIAEQVAEKLGLDRWIDIVVGAGTYALKPDPEPLAACLSRLELQPADTLYIGDMAVDRQAAAAAGIRVLLAEFGYSTTPVSQLGANGTLTHWTRLGDAIAALEIPYQQA